MSKLPEWAGIPLYLGVVSASFFASIWFMLLLESFGVGMAWLRAGQLGFFLAMALASLAGIVKRFPSLFPEDPSPGKPGS